MSAEGKGGFFYRGIAEIVEACLRESRSVDAFHQKL
jgi:hypothetical protein